MRASDGKITEFDAPSASGGTVPVSINAGGDIAGFYVDTDHVDQAFVRTNNGSIVEFNVLDSWTSVGGINEVGDIAGFYFDGNTGLYHGFVRASNGKMTTFEAPSAGKGYLQGTVALDINTAGSVTGYYVDSKNIIHGFVRASNGVITDFDVPGTILTSPYAINTAGDITGYCIDANNVHQGFMRKP